MKNFYLQFWLHSFALIALFGAAIHAQTTPNKNFGAKRWTLVQLYGGPVANSKAYVEFNETENRIAGNAGCNRMFGTFETNGKNIKFGAVGTTRMACADGFATRIETEFLRALGEATRFRKQGDALRVYAKNRLILRFRVRAADKNDSGESIPAIIRVQDKKWVLEAVKNDQPARTEILPFLVFDESKKSAGGNTGCNSFGGNYTVEEENLKIAEIISTRRACVEDGKMNVEKEFLDGLQNVNRFEIIDGKLFLYQDKNLLLTFNAQNK